MTTNSLLSPAKLVTLWLLLLVALGGWLRVHGVNDYYYSLDELLSVSISKGATVSEVVEFEKYETHPPYAQILRHYLLEISEAPWFVRGESVLFGLLCILVYYWLGKQMDGRLAGCIAAYLITFGYGNILQSQIVRNYELLALFIVLGFYYYRAFLESQKRCHLAGYATAMLLALMTHYSAFFTMACMGVAGLITLLKLPDRKALSGWIVANGLLAVYFAYVWATELRHNDYESMWIPPAGSDYNTLHYRFALFIAYIPVTASYFLHSSFVTQLSIPSTVLFVFCMIWLHQQPARRAFFYEAMLGLGLGAFLVAANIYPYVFKVGGRHAMWVLPYAILPLSLFLANAARVAVQKWGGASLAFSALFALVAGVVLNPSGLFLSELREYQVDNNQMRQIKTFLKTLSPDDVIITAGLNVMYLLPDGDNYYRELSQQGMGHWYYSASTGISRILHTRQYPPMMDGKQVSMREFLARLEKEGQLKGTRNIWIFNTALCPFSDTLGPCKGLPATRVQYPDGGLSELPEHTPAAEFIGMPHDAFMRDVVSPEGRYARCF